MNDQNQFNELRELLKENASEVPHRDLEDGFLRDLHQRLNDSSASAKVGLWEQVSTKFAELTGPKLAWSGGAFAACALAITAGAFYFSGTTENFDTLASVDFGNHEIVNSYKHIDLDGSIPAFLEESYDF